MKIIHRSEFLFTLYFVVVDVVVVSDVKTGRRQCSLVVGAIYCSGLVEAKEWFLDSNPAVTGPKR